MKDESRGRSPWALLVIHAGQKRAGRQVFNSKQLLQVLKAGLPSRLSFEIHAISPDRPDQKILGRVVHLDKLEHLRSVAGRLKSGRSESIGGECPQAFLEDPMRLQ